MLELLLALKFVEPFKLPVTAAAADEALSKLNAPEEPSPPVDILTARWPPVMFGNDPNITGRITSIRSWSSSVQCVGAFSGSYIRDNVLNSVSGSGDDAFDLALKASDDNATYSGTGLQPSAIQCMPCIRC